MNSRSYYIGNCSICREYGMLEIVHNFKKRDCSTMCEECFAEWNDPEDALKNANGFRKSYKEAESRAATIEGIKELGWEKYVLD